MLSTERPQFEQHASVLFAGCNLPASPERIEAFWRGLHDMPLGSFVRVVESLLGEHGPENLQKITTQQLWSTYRKLRTRNDSRPAPLQESDDDRAARTRRMQSIVDMRNTMPKSKSGHLNSSPDSLHMLPEPERSRMKQLWDEWSAKHPGMWERYSREMDLFLTGRTSINVTQGTGHVDHD